MNNKISAQIVADSVNWAGNRITSFVLTYPRFIHSELMTHRMFSRNAASSRAIPFEKMIEMVDKDPFIPIAWQKDHKGMQGVEYFPGNQEGLRQMWLEAKDKSVAQAKLLSSIGVTKQICNRLLEPFMWYTVLVTSTEFENFFDLRCPKYKMVNDSGVTTYYRSQEDYLEDLSTHDYFQMKDYDLLQWLSIDDSMAEIHMQALAEAMWNAYNESNPVKMEIGRWHMPFGDRFDPARLSYWDEVVLNADDINKSLIKIAVARAARLSYMTFDNEIDYKKDIELHDTLLKSRHMSPFEHCACSQAYDKFYANFRGWKSYRQMIEEK